MMDSILLKFYPVEYNRWSLLSWCLCFLKQKRAPSYTHVSVVYRGVQYDCVAGQVYTDVVNEDNAVCSNVPVRDVDALTRLLLQKPKYMSCVSFAKAVVRSATGHLLCATTPDELLFEWTQPQTYNCHVPYNPCTIDVHC